MKFADFTINLKDKYHDKILEGWLSQVESTTPLTWHAAKRIGGSNPSPSTNAEGRAEAIPVSRLRIDGAWQEGEADWSESTG